MAGRLEDALLETAERIIALAAGDEHSASLCAEGVAWLGASDRAGAIFAGVLASARAASASDRPHRLSSLAAAQSRALWITAARRVVDELAALPVDWSNRLSLPLQVAEARLECRQPELARVALGQARDALQSAQRQQYLVQKLALLQIEAGDLAAAEETFPLVRAGANDAFARSGLVRVAARLGKVDEAWALLEGLVPDPINLAVAISDAIRIAPDRVDAMREILSRVSDPSTQATLLISVASGLASSPEHVDIALEILDEALQRLASASADHRWSALVRAAEVTHATGRDALTARYARQSQECLGPSPDPSRVSGTGRALARSGERDAAHRLLLDSLARRSAAGLFDWEMAILMRDIAFSFPAPPER